MDDGVAYMVMGEGGEAQQATQMVAVDNGDGTQQLVRWLGSDGAKLMVMVSIIMLVVTVNMTFMVITVVDPNDG